MISERILEQLNQMRKLTKIATERDIKPISKRRGKKAVYNAYVSLVEHHNIQSNISNQVIMGLLDVIETLGTTA